ncbi:alpha/beta hydrolase [Aliamphritea hakodatensis]|uniref:alpha/beta hydrolase n=1 Tax=Aliamphritea hakodatensis TaxID=2895352 RepID=UPI0022FD9466|nr:alpha/beta hydrolase [Aliamphritea hakodatensis]
MAMFRKELGFKERHFEVDGRSFAARQWGKESAPVLIALHGWLDNSASFNALAPLLDRYCVVALDFAGHGLSDYRPAGMAYYVWDNVPDVLAVAEQLQAKQFSILGHSMGAGVAALLAACYPEKVDRLLLIEGIGPVVTEAESAPGQLYRALQKRERIRNRDVNTFCSREEAVLARSNGRWPVSEQAAGWLAERGVSSRSAASGKDEYFWHHDPWLVLPSPVRLTETQVQYFLRKITAPVTLVLGDHGIEQHPDRMACLKTCQVFHLAGGHHLHMEPETAKKVANSFAECENGLQ